MEKGADACTFLRIVEISGLWKIDYSYFGIKLMNCENFFLDIKYFAYLLPMNGDFHNNSSYFRKL